MDPKIRDLAVENSEAALRTIIEIAANKRAAFSTRLAAANSILDRAFGKPGNSIEVTGTQGESLREEHPLLRGLTGNARLIAISRAVGVALYGGKLALEREQAAKGKPALIDLPFVGDELRKENSDE